jgi:hypothetical protein
MLNLEMNNIALEGEAAERLTAFYDRYCDGVLGAEYGASPLLFACHAAFPLLLSPEMANLIWINFRDYHFQDGRTGTIPSIVVADLLLSPLCRQTGHNRYEMQADIRAALLRLLKSGQFFDSFGIDTGGEERLRDLAGFVWQYSTTRTDPGADATRFRLLNEWASLAWLDPGQLSAQVAELLSDTDKTNNRYGHLWLYNQLDRLNTQFQTETPATDQPDLALQSFFNLFHISRAKRNELLNKTAGAVFESIRQIDNRRLRSAPGRYNTIRVKLSRSMAERAQRSLSDVQRVFVIAITEEKLDGPFLNRSLPVMERSGRFRFDIIRVPIDQPSSIDHEQAIRHILETANSEDSLLLYFPNLTREDPGFRQFLDPLADNWPEETKMDALSIVGTSFEQEEPWTEAVRLLGVQHVPDAPPFPPLDAAFSTLLAQVIQALPEITYLDLQIWLRFLLLPGYPSDGPNRVVYRGPEGTAWHSFLTRREKRRRPFSLLAYDPIQELWQVLPEDFQVLPYATNSTVHHYSTGVRVNDRVGELVTRNDGLLYYGGDESGMAKRMLYLVRVSRRRLDIAVPDDFPAAEREQISSEILDAAARPGDAEGYLLWGSYRLRSPAEDPVFFSPRPGLLTIMLSGRQPGGYVLSYQEEPAVSGVPEVMVWEAADTRAVARLVTRLSAYLYLKYLKFPDNPRSPTPNPLMVTVSGQWTGPDGSPSDPTDGPLALDGSAFSIIGGRLVANTLTLRLSNHEKFPLYCAVYLLSADLSIIPLSLAPNLFVAPGESARIEYVGAPLLDVARLQLPAHLKFLYSRDPIQHNFSQ